MLEFGDVGKFINIYMYLLLDLSVCRMSCTLCSGADPELDCGGIIISFSYEKFLNTIVCCRKHSRLEAD